MLTAISLYLQIGAESLFCLFQPAADGVPRGAAVLICAPWGWDEVASYRSCRRWAERLAAAGHPTMRFDLPAGGDSGGMPGDANRVDTWVEAIAAAAADLRERSGASRVAVLGLGLGGLLAREAAARGAAIEELALWASPTKGSSFAREARAFSRLQEGGPLGADGEPEPTPLPEGWMEVGGFVLSAETLSGLKALDPPASAGLRRALLLDRDGLEPDAALRTGLEEAGVEVSLGAGEGWGEMVSHPERTRLPAATAARVEQWLREGEAASEGGTGAAEVPATAEAPSENETPTAGASQGTTPTAASVAPRDRADAVIELDEGMIRESPLLVAQSYGNAFGVLAEPVDPAPADLCAVFLNPGAVRHTGPNRLWVETARRWAAQGVPSLRVDLEGIGDADGDDGLRRDVASFYVPGFVDQVRAVLDALEARGCGKRFLLVGLCAGGYWSFQTAIEDGRVERAVLLNAGALTWHDNLLEQRQASKLDRVFQWSWWRKLFEGEVKPSRLWYFARLAAAKALAKLRGRLSSFAPGSVSGPPPGEIDTDLDRLRDRGADLTMAFSGGEPLHTELQVKGILGQLERWPNLRLVDLPGSDHSLRPIAAQRAAAELLDAELARTSHGHP